MNAECGMKNAESKTNPVKEPDLRKRTKCFALDVIEFFESLPRTETARVLGRQLLRAGTAVGANYRAACRAKSTADFISKLGNVEEEADESGYWLELLLDRNLGEAIQTKTLMAEADELVAITIASINPTRRTGGRQ